MYPFGTIKSRHAQALRRAVISASTLFACGFTVSAVEHSKSADAFVDSMGVCIHMTYDDTAYGNYAGFVKPELVKLGVRHVRDGLAVENATAEANFNDLAAQSPPIKAILILSPSNAVAISSTLANALEMIEGANEVDNPSTPLTYGTYATYGSSPASPAAAQHYQTDLYNAVKASQPAMLVAALSFCRTGYTLTGVLPCDYGNIHSYAAGEPGSSLDSNIEWIPLVTGGYKPIIATETGYSTWNPDTTGSNSSFTANNDPTTAAYAKYIPRSYAEHFRRGIYRAYIYELLEEWSTWNTALTGTCQQSRYGLVSVSASGSGSSVVLTEKPAFTSVKNLISILQEPGASFVPGDLGFTIAGTNTQYLRHVLLQKSDGSFWLVLWQNLQSCTMGQWPNTDIANPAQNVTITLDNPFSGATYYQPSQSPSALSFPSGATITPSSGTIANLPVPDELIIIEITGAVASVAPVSMKADVSMFGAAEALLSGTTANAPASAIAGDNPTMNVGSANPTTGCRSLVKFDLPVLPAGMTIVGANLQFDYLSMDNFPTTNADLAAFEPLEDNVRTTDWDDLTNSTDLGTVLAPGSATGAQQVNSGALLTAIANAYTNGKDSIALRFQLSNGVLITGGTTSVSNYYVLGTSHNNTAGYHPLLSLDLANTITTSVGPNGGGTTSGGGSYVTGSSATVVAVPATGFGFVNWTVAGAPVSTSSSYTFTATGSCFLVANCQMTFTSWQAAYFSAADLANPGISGPTADPAGDGFSNLAKYAFGSTKPKIANLSLNPTVGIEGGCLSLTYMRNSAVSDVNYTVEVSGDLVNWNSGGAYTTSPAVIVNGVTNQTVQVSDLTPTSSAPRRFIRLRLQLSAP